ncbi:protein ZGRF1-like isoform X3 [Acipenser ruthenus]|uniref:protein ZGRF1-like isoform X3 n=1 Tax=Acipenser ruthenus TaxID=7906 RepID=UPI00274277A3|nr:protein ZGRF1-like isoform X3 [Acipenser ruthenus]
MFPEFIALYTHQKTKKAKTWQDGVLKISIDGNKATLFDEKGQKLDAVYLRGQKVKPGDDLESDRYLITVEEEKITENSSPDQHGPKEISEQNGRLYPPVTMRQNLPVGLKRKYTGYRGPRQIQKKPATEENEVSSLKFQHNLSSSLLYNTSPLFSIKTPTTLATGFHDSTFSANVKHEQLEQNLSVPSLPAPIVVSLHQKTNNKQRHYDYTESRHQPSNDLLSDQDNTPGVTQITDGNYQPTHTISKGIRSKAQILALLRSNASNVTALKTSNTGQHQPLKDTSGSAAFCNQNSRLLAQDTHSTDLDQVTQKTTNTIVTSNLDDTSCWNSSFLEVSTEQEHEGNDQENTVQGEQKPSCDLTSHNDNTLVQAPAQSLTENRFKQPEGYYNAILRRSRWESFLPDKKQDNEECLSPDHEPLGNDMSVFQTSAPPPLDHPKEDSEELATIELIEKNICPTQGHSYNNTTENVLTQDNKLEKPVLLEMSEMQGTESKECFEGVSSSATSCSPGKEDLLCLNFSLLDDFDLDNMEEDEVQESLLCRVLADGDGGSKSQEYEEKRSGVIEEKVLSDPYKWVDDVSVGDEQIAEIKLVSNVTMGDCHAKNTVGLRDPLVLPPTPATVAKIASHSLDFSDSEVKCHESEENERLSQHFENIAVATDEFSTCLKADNQMKSGQDSPYKKDIHPSQENNGEEDISDIGIEEWPANWSDVEQHYKNSVVQATTLDRLSATPSTLRTPENQESTGDIYWNEADINNCSPSVQSSNEERSHLTIVNKTERPPEYMLQKLSSCLQEQFSDQPVEMREPLITKSVLIHPEYKGSRGAGYNANASPKLSVNGHDHLSLLKTLSEHSTALESLEMFRSPDREFRIQRQIKEQLCSSVMIDADETQELMQMTQKLSPFHEAPAEKHMLVLHEESSMSDWNKACNSRMQTKPLQFTGSQEVEFWSEEGWDNNASIRFAGSTSYPRIEELIPQSKAPSWLSCSADSDFESTQWSSWEPHKIMSPAQMVPSLSPVPGSLFGLLCSYEEGQGQVTNDSLIQRAPLSIAGSSMGSSVSTGSRNSRDAGTNSAFRLRAPIVTAPLAASSVEVPPESDVFSDVNECNEVEQRSAISSLNSFHKHSPSLSLGRVRPGDIKSKNAFCKETIEASTQEPTLSTICNVTSQGRQSKWLKYQNTSQSDRIAQNRGEWCGTAQDGSGERKEAVMQRSAAADCLSIHQIKETLVKQQRPVNGQGVIAGKQIHSLNSGPTYPECKQQGASRAQRGPSVSRDSQNIAIAELSFPQENVVKDVSLPKREIHIPVVFQSHAHYKQVFTAALTEHLNILLFDLSQSLHRALSKVDISSYTSVKPGREDKQDSFVPFCQHQQPSKLVMVKKEGKNKGRFFYTCDASNKDKCSFFKWFNEVKPGSSLKVGESQAKMMLSDVNSMSAYIRSQHIPLYSQCHLMVRKSFDFQRKQFYKGKFKNHRHDVSELTEVKPRLYLRLSRKENSSSYSKDDLWVVSKTLLFDPLDTFIGCSAFFGPSSSNELELVPLKGYFTSNWPSDMVVHALHVCNASTELTSLRNLQEHFNPASLPLMPRLLKMPDTNNSADQLCRQRRGFVPPAITPRPAESSGLLSSGRAPDLAAEMIDSYHLNTDQAAVLSQIAKMMEGNNNPDNCSGQDLLPITIVHGVFGSGKSYLLAVIVLFLVRLFAEIKAADGPRRTLWKLLISSSTNVAVDRVLLGLLDLGFDRFIRVGSVRKIARPILPHSLHAGSDSEQLRELQTLLRGDLSNIEKAYVRKSIEQHKLGRNKGLLKEVQVVGATCAACTFPCMNNLTFPVVLLDECSQITEPASLQPIARFGCEKLVLVGDPKQLPPTIQGSEGAHEAGMEQTLFDRLCLMGYKPVLLRTQYRCHPAISAIANKLFYDGALIDGITDSDRSPLLDWLPTVCFYSVKGTEQIQNDGSFHNIEEAVFTLKLIQSLIASGIEGSMIGVITLYKSQMYKLSNLLHSDTYCDHSEVKHVQVSTVDAFQGAEKEIIVLSCVRTKQVGFIDSEKRMNVALTRGKRHLLIVGNLHCLRKNKLWERVICHCEGRDSGLQHSYQLEGQLDSIMKAYLDKKNEERGNTKAKKGPKTKKRNEVTSGSPVDLTRSLPETQDQNENKPSFYLENEKFSTQDEKKNRKYKEIFNTGSCVESLSGLDCDEDLWDENVFLT